MDFFTRSNSIGLELDTGEIRVVQLRGTPQSPQLVTWGSYPLPEGALVDGMVEQPIAVTSALLGLWSQMGLGVKQVVLGVANQGVLVRFASFPRVPPEKISQMVRLQAGEYLPIPLSSVVFDYAVVGENQAADGMQLEVMLVAARRDMLREYLLALGDARLEPYEISVSPLALLKILPRRYHRETLAILYIGNGYATITILQQGSPRLTRLLTVNLQQLAQMEKCSLDQLKLSGEPNGDTEDLIRMPACLNWGNNLATEISNSINYYQRKMSQGNISCLLLSGKGGRMKELPALLETTLGLKVEMLDPLEGIKMPARIDNRDHIHATDYAVSLGLAVRGLEV